MRAFFVFFCWLVSFICLTSSIWIVASFKNVPEVSPLFVNFIEPSHLHISILLLNMAAIVGAIIVLMIVPPIDRVLWIFALGGLAAFLGAFAGIALNFLSGLKIISSYFTVMTGEGGRGSLGMAFVALMLILYCLWRLEHVLPKALPKVKLK